MTDIRPSAAFLVRHPAHFIALGFGAGLAPFAPGTFGTLVALPIALLLWQATNSLGFVVVIVLAFAIGVWVSEMTGRALQAADHGAIIWDEVVAFLLVLFFVGPNPAGIIAGFVLFRFFDIVKPPPIRQLDTMLKNGFGVMIDDVVAAGYTLLVIALWHRLWN